MRKVIELQQPGVHIYVKDKLVRQLMEKLQVEGYPSYVVFRTGSTLSEKIGSVKNLDLKGLKAYLK